MLYVVADTGYTSICPDCCSRHSEQAELVGRERWLSSTICSKCIAKKLATKQRDKLFFIPDGVGE